MLALVVIEQIDSQISLGFDGLFEPLAKNGEKVFHVGFYLVGQIVSLV